MLNDCVSAHWSPMYQYLALTSLRDSHRLPTKHICEPGNVRRLFFSIPYFRFRTSVSVLRFPHFCVFHLPQTNTLGIHYLSYTHGFIVKRGHKLTVKTLGGGITRLVSTPHIVFTACKKIHYRLAPLGGGHHLFSHLTQC